MALESTVRGGLWIGAAQGVARGGSFALTVLIGRVLGEAALGSFAILWTLLSLMMVLADWGQQAALTRHIARTPGNLAQHLGRALRLALWPTLLGMVVLVTLGPPLSDTPWTPALLLSLSLPLMALRNALLGGFRALGRWHWEFSTALADRLLMLAGAGLALFLDAGIGAICGAVLLGQVAGLALSFQGFRGLGITRKGLAEGVGMLSSSERASGAFLMLAGLSAAVYVRGDVLILGFFHPAEVVGAYAANATLVMAAGLLPQVVLSAWYPELSRMGVSARERLEKAWRFLALLGVVEILVGFWLGGDLLRWVYGISGGALVACLLWAGEAINSLNYAGGAVQRAANRERWLVALMALAAGLNIVANFVLIPFFGPLGAAISTFAAYSLIAFGHAFASPRPLRLAGLVALLGLLGVAACVLMARHP